jgi:PTH1 family peptidyl-tRNA hydrolase
MAQIRLVAGLGNPGRGYATTRHNAGFWFVDALARKLGASLAPESRFAGDLGKAGTLRLVKPSTYMNDSGRSVGALAHFFDIAPDEILVVHDELDLKPGEAKMKLGAASRATMDCATSSRRSARRFWRLRLGIGHPRDSELPQQDVVDYVLKPPRAEEGTALDAAITRALGAWPDVARGDMERAMMLLHTKVGT